MTIEHFNTLDEKDQNKAVWKGMCLGYREEREYKIITYKVFDFYVELYYHIEHNALKKINAISYLTKDIVGKMNPGTVYE